MAVTNLSPNVDNYLIGKGIVSWKPEGVSGQWRDVGNVPEFEFTPNLDKLDHFSSRTGIRSKDRSVVQTKSATVRIIMEEWTADNLAMLLLGDPSEAFSLTTTGDVHETTTLDNIASLAGVVAGRTYHVAGTGIPDGATFDGPAGPDADTVTLSAAGTAAGTDVALTITAPPRIEIFSNSETRGSLRLVGTNDVGAKITWVFPLVSFTPSKSISPITDEWGQIEIEGEVLLVNGSFGWAESVDWAEASA